MEQKLKPSDQKFELEVAKILRENDAISPDAAMGPFAIYNRIKIDRPGWMLSPLRTRDILDEMVKKNDLLETSTSKKYYLRV